MIFYLFSSLKGFIFQTFLWFEELNKYGCRIKAYFLSIFVEKINEKKYFEYCLFILTFEYYDINNNEVFDVLFNYLSHISIDYCDNNQIKQL